MKKSLALVVTIILVIIVNAWIGCNQSPAPQDPVPPRPEEAVIEIPYELIAAEQPGKEFKPMAMFPGLQIRRIEMQPMGVSQLQAGKDNNYGELNALSPTPTKSTCAGSKSCDFKCGNQPYRVVGIPDNCRCYSHEGGMDIVCPDGCNSYEISCLR